MSSCRDSGFLSWLPRYFGPVAAHFHAHKSLLRHSATAHSVSVTGNTFYIVTAHLHVLPEQLHSIHTRVCIILTGEEEMTAKPKEGCQALSAIVGMPYSGAGGLARSHAAQSRASSWDHPCLC